jgi:hypothetical protein
MSTRGRTIKHEKRVEEERKGKIRIQDRSGSNYDRFGKS